MQKGTLCRRKEEIGEQARSCPVRQSLQNTEAGRLQQTLFENEKALAELLPPLVVFPGNCYTLFTCSADDVFVSGAEVFIRLIKKGGNCVRTCFRAWAAMHDAPPGLAHPARHRVAGSLPIPFSSFAASPLCALSTHFTLYKSESSLFGRANAQKCSLPMK